MDSTEEKGEIESVIRCWSIDSWRGRGQVAKIWDTQQCASDSPTPMKR